ncbi:MAG: glucose-6-phosphate dehydrogenase [Candidatus Binataceae bacterium]
MAETLTIAKAHTAAPCTIVIFGATGDLARRKLLPALYNLRACGDGTIAPNTAVAGFSRREISSEEFRKTAHDAAMKYSRLKIDERCWKEFAGNLDYTPGLDQTGGFVRLKQHLEQIEAARGLPPNRVFYLSIPPEAIDAAVEGLHAAGLIAPPGAEHFSRLVVEKPIGHDLASALEINRTLRRYFDESQIFRIDHYLGKEAVQNLLVLRFANSIFEQMWSNRSVDHVQITVAETEGVGTRAAYYDRAGALRDMVQNHMLQLLTLIAMEPPVSLEAAAVRAAKLDVLRSLRPIGDRAQNSVVRARYGGGMADGKRVRGYLEESDISGESDTETFVALKLFVDNWRWSGVPFYLRTGKRMAARSSAIFVQFKDVPAILFNRNGGLTPDVLTLRIQPDEGFSFDVLAKSPGLDVSIRPVRMNLHYESEFEGKPSPDAYERLLLDIMTGDHTLFISSEYVRLSWQYIQTILDEWKNDSKIPMDVYPAGGWGPESANHLIAADHRQWRNP